MLKKFLSAVAILFLLGYSLTHWDVHALKASVETATDDMHGAPSKRLHAARAEHEVASGTNEPGQAITPRQAVTKDALRDNPNVALGIPFDSDPSDDLLIDERAFVVSYNPPREGPNWVAWKLDRSTLGHTPRRNDFHPDLALPPGVHRVTPDEYAHSGYDRGHMCPSADRDESPEDNGRTFVMTNMLPQVHELNAGPWEKLEQYERELARKRNAAIYIVAGGVFSPSPERLRSGVAIPEATFKVIVALRDGSSAQEVDESTKVIAVVMPNRKDIGDTDWKQFTTTVSHVEELTGYDFLSNVPAAMQKRLEHEKQTP